MFVVYLIHLGNCHGFYPRDTLPSFQRRTRELLLSESVWMVPGTWRE